MPKHVKRNAHLARAFSLQFLAVFPQIRTKFFAVAAAHKSSALHKPPLCALIEGPGRGTTPQGQRSAVASYE